MSKELYLKARDECIKNVHQYMLDSKRLIEIGSYGHAYALSIIGQEELAKAEAFHIVSGLPNDLREPFIEWHTKGTKAHMAKLELHYLLSQLRKVKEAVDKGIPVAEAFEKAFGKYRSAVKALEQKNNTKLHKEIEKSTKATEKINKLKMDALYVGIEGRHIKSPNQIIFKELALESLKELEKNVDFANNIIFKTGFAEVFRWHGN